MGAISLLRWTTIPAELLVHSENFSTCQRAYLLSSHALSEDRGYQAIIIIPTPNQTLSPTVVMEC